MKKALFIIAVFAFNLAATVHAITLLNGEIRIIINNDKQEQSIVSNYISAEQFLIHLVETKQHWENNQDYRCSIDSIWTKKTRFQNSKMLAIMHCNGK